MNTSNWDLLLIKFYPSYEAGSICLFFAGLLFHKVAHWTPKVQTLDQQAQNITPGRIGNVFFFPKPSFELLKGKPPLWGRVTSFGRNEKFLTPGMLSRVPDEFEVEADLPFNSDREDEDSDMDISDNN